MCFVFVICNFFSALACVAFAGSSFASNEIVCNLSKIETNEVKVFKNFDDYAGLCTVVVEIYDKATGKLLHRSTHTKITETPKECDDWGYQLKMTIMFRYMILQPSPQF